jgi:hypothetical protein
MRKECEPSSGASGFAAARVRELERLHRNFGAVEFRERESFPIQCIWLSESSRASGPPLNLELYPRTCGPEVAPNSRIALRICYLGDVE